MSNEPAPRRTHPVTPVREDIFIQAIEDGGSPSAAAAMARPDEAPERHGGLSTWRDHARRNAEFAVRWQQAREKYLGRLETELSRRVLQGHDRPVFQQGRLVGHENQRSDVLLLRALGAHDPEKWSERHKSDVNVTSRSATIGIHVELTASDVNLLTDPDERRSLAKLLSKIADLKSEQEPDGEARSES